MEQDLLEKETQGVVKYIRNCRKETSTVTVKEVEVEILPWLSSNTWRRDSGVMTEIFC